MTEDVLIRQERGVLYLTLNRPEKLNALTDAMKEAIVAGVRTAAEDDDIRAVLITGNGRGFCTGADLSSGLEGSPMVTPLKAPRTQWYRGRWGWITDLRSLEKPVISAINGVAAGAGMALGLVADVRFASDQASFVTAFTDRAILPDAGTSYLLSRSLGPQRALHLLYRGGRISAEEALRYGLVEEVVPNDELADRAREYAEHIASGPAVVVELTKRLAYRAWESPSLLGHAEYEQFLWTFSRATEDYAEGRRSFQERREPRYTGR